MPQAFSTRVGFGEDRNDVVCIGVQVGADHGGEAGIRKRDRPSTRENQVACPGLGYTELIT